MRLLDVRSKPLESIDLIRRRRILFILVAYWWITVCTGLALYFGVRMDLPKVLAHVPLEWFPGIASLAIYSFDREYLKVFILFSEATAWIGVLIGWIWLPSGSERLHGSVASKSFLVFCTALLLIGATSMVFTEKSFNGVSDGAGSVMLYLGASSLIGSLTMLNFLFGFAQLFFGIALKIVLSARIAVD